MEVNRRTLLKGMVAGGALLALGVPASAFAALPSRRPKHCVLLLGGTDADDVFASGARGVCAGMTYDGLQTVKLKGGLLTGTDRIAKLLEQSQGARWIALMDDASAVIFLELVRTLGIRLLSTGSHVYSGDGSCHLRHDWLVASPSQSVGGLLASQLSGRQDSFSITERVLYAPSEASPLTSWSAPGFFSYRLAEPEAIYMHCSGVSLAAGCQLLGVDTCEGWIPIPPLVGKRNSVTWQSESWVESLGYAVTASALGLESVRESCSGRAFVHRSHDKERIQPTERFVSFVMDV